MSKEWRMLPSGYVTQNVEEYLNAWNKLGSELCSVLGGWIDSFDPVLFWNSEIGKYDFHSVQFSVPQANLIIERARKTNIIHPDLA